jgi:formate dehydrogenase maturation protein FdhE
MAVATTTATLYSERRRRVGELRERYRFVRQVLDFYGALLSVQERAYMEAAEIRPSAGELVDYVAEMVVPRVVEVTVAAGPDRLRAAVLDDVDGHDPRSIVGTWVRSGEQTEVERYLARAALTPVLEAAGPDLRSVCTGPRDGFHCPDCGGPPQVSFFERSPDDLATGPRYLLCARCGRTWGYARMRCAACGVDAGAKLNIFSEHGTTSGERGSVVRGLAGPNAARSDAVFPHMRVEACESCRRYLLSVDLATDFLAVPTVDEMAAIPLDLFARERGYAKITPNLVGF